MKQASDKYLELLREYHAREHDDQLFERLDDAWLSMTPREQAAVERELLTASDTQG